MAECTSVANSISYLIMRFSGFLVVGVLIVNFYHLLQPVIEGSRKGRQEMIPVKQGSA